MGFRQVCEAAFGIEITARDMLGCETIAALTAHITGKMAETGTAVEAVDAEGEIVAMEPARPARSPLSDGQRGLWVLQKLAPEMSAYNIPLCYRTRQPLNVEAFAEACRLILKRHAVLADAIREEDGVPYRSAAATAAPFLYREDVSGIADEALLSVLRQKAKQPFALESGPLLRVHLLERSREETIVLLVIHHIAFDIGSMLPFMRELMASYRALARGERPALEAAPASYADFVAWERSMMSGPKAAEHLAYWKRHLAGAPAVLAC